MSVKAYARWAMALMVANAAMGLLGVAGCVAFYGRSEWWGVGASMLLMLGTGNLFVRARRVWRAARMTMVWDARRRASRWN